MLADVDRNMTSGYLVSSCAADFLDLIDRKEEERDGRRLISCNFVSRTACAIGAHSDLSRLAS